MEEKKSTPADANRYAMRPFASRKSFRDWLEKNHAGTDGIWLRFYKKSSGKRSISYAEALDEALCFGWIDGQVRSLDEQSWIHKFTPRRPRSGWSRRNTEHIERLTRDGVMTEAGLREVEKAKADGRWAAAYDSPRNALPPQDFLDALSGNSRAKAFFKTLNKANVYSIVYRLQTAKKPATRERRMKLILEMLNQGKAFH